MNYTFRTENDKNAFEEFVLANGGIYMQSAKWAEVKKEWHSTLYSGFDGNGTRVLTALIMDRHIPLAGKISYCPAGAVCDLHNAELVKAFADFMKKEMKKNGITALFFDPCVELRVNGEKKAEGKAVHDTLTSCGFMLNTDASKCLYKSPVQLILPLKDPSGVPYTPEKLLKGFEKGIRYSVRIGEGRGLTEAVYTIDDIKKDPSIMRDFLDVMHDTSSRDDFVERSGDYCERLLEVFGKDGMDIMLVYYDKKKDAAQQKQRLERKAELEKALPDAPLKRQKGIKEEIESIDRQTEHFETRVKETSGDSREKICVSGGLTVHYNKMSSCLFGGAKDLLRNELRSSHYFNFRRICRSLALNNDYHDLGYVLLKKTDPDSDGTLGECVPQDNFEGICAFKKSFGADYIEYIGEYVLVADKIKYFSYSHLIDPAREAQAVVNRIVRKGRNKE